MTVAAIAILYQLLHLEEPRSGERPNPEPLLRLGLTTLAAVAGLAIAGSALRAPAAGAAVDAVCVAAIRPVTLSEAKGLSGRRL